MPPPPDLALLLAQIQYPGMTWVESRITEAWLRAHGAEFDAIDFNVRLGAGVDPGAGYDDSTRRQAQLVTQKRADIIATVPGFATIVEVKVRVGLPVIGQLIGYRELYRRWAGYDGHISLLAIGRSVVSDVEEIIRGQGIAMELFPRVEFPAEE